MSVAIIVLILILVAFAIFVISVYNGLVSTRNQVRNAWSQIDVELQRRFDLIPNLIETVKGYASHEKEIFESITKLRTEYNQTKDLSKASLLNSQIDKILLIGENYPELKSSENFLHLQKTLTKMEDQLQAARRLYNIDVTAYNTSLQTFPTNIISSVFNFKEENLFELEPGKDANIKVNI